MIEKCQKTLKQPWFGLICVFLSFFSSLRYLQPCSFSCLCSLYADRPFWKHSINLTCCHKTRILDVRELGKKNKKNLLQILPLFVHVIASHCDYFGPVQKDVRWALPPSRLFSEKKSTRNENDFCSIGTIWCIDCNGSGSRA